MSELKCDDSCSYDREPAYWLIATKRHSGNPSGDDFVLWWAPNACGYTRDVTKAGRYTSDEARRHSDGTHGQDVPVLEEVAVGKATGVPWAALTKNRRVDGVAT